MTYVGHFTDIIKDYFMIRVLKSGVNSTHVDAIHIQFGKKPT